jgi:nitrogen regulatory protein PII-like uncharacterized protein
MDKLTLLQNAGIPITSLVETRLGNYHAEFTRTLTPEEWLTYEQIVYPARLRRRLAKDEAAKATALKTITPEQAVEYINKNVTDLASAKKVLKLMARMLIAMRDEIWSDLPES